MTEDQGEVQARRERFLAEYQGPDRIVSAQEYLALHGAETLKSKTFYSGFSQFDKHLEGIQGGELTVISGHTRNGKTLFAESWLRRLMDQGIGGCYFSFEVSASKAIEKFLPHEKDVIMHDKVHPENSSLFVPNALKTMSVDWLLDRIEEAKLKYDCRVFVVDHLHFIVDMMTQQNMSLNIGATMRRLKMDGANNLNVAIILIAHQGQSNDKSRENEASLENIRDSSFIAQEADNVILVSRRRDFKHAELSDLPEDLQNRILLRSPDMFDLENPYKSGFATIQIAKARRSGTFRWSKLFQKVSHFLEEV